jgi:hypothetical protein
MPTCCKSTTLLGPHQPEVANADMASAGRRAVPHQQPDHNRLCNWLLIEVSALE